VIPGIISIIIGYRHSNRFFAGSGRKRTFRTACGNSKSDKIERRLFSEITKHWRGQPLTSLEVVRDLIASTTTRTGLKVRARIDRTVYPRGIKVSDQQMDALSIVREDFHGEWNYMMLPRPVLDIAA
jgi:hypothetical protein